MLQQNTHKRHAQKRLRHMLKTAYGPTIGKALSDPSVVEILVNPDGYIWIEDHNRLVNSGDRLADSQVERIIRLVATQCNTQVHDDSPHVSAELPETGERFEGVLPPSALAPTFAIRKKARLIYTLSDYVQAKIISPDQERILRAALDDKCNIVIVGGTGSGKTTLVNALLDTLSKTDERIILLEDTRELQCSAENSLSLRTVPGITDLRDLVRSTLRLRPDRIIVGEVRGGEALDMLKAWNTGHPGGLTTIHANSAIAGLYRIEQLANEVVSVIPKAAIAQAIDLLVFISGRGTERRVESLVTIKGLTQHNAYDTHRLDCGG